MKILITGFSGFVGINVTKLFLEKGYRVIGISRSGRVPHALRGARNLRVIRGDIVSPNFWNGLQKKIRPDVVMHLAGFTQALKITDNPRPLFDANVVGTFNVLEFCRRGGGILLITASTGQVYPLGDGVARSFYGASKYAADVLCQEYMLTYRVPMVINRIGVLYGPHFTVGKTVQEYTSWVNWFLAAQCKGLSITVIDNGAGVRDPLFVGDLARLFEIEARTKKMWGNVFNVGGGPRNKISVRGVVKLIERITKQSFAETQSATSGDKARLHYVSDIGALQPYWQPKMPLEKGLRETLRWLRGALKNHEKN